MLGESHMRYNADLLAVEGGSRADREEVIGLDRKHGDTEGETLQYVMFAMCVCMYGYMSCLILSCLVSVPMSAFMRVPTTC